MAAAPWPGDTGRDAHGAQPPWPPPDPGTVPPIVRGGGGTVPPIVRGSAAAPSGHYPAVAPSPPPPVARASPRATGAFPGAAPPARPSGSVPVVAPVRQGPRATGKLGVPSGGFAAVGPATGAPHPSTGSLRAVSALPGEGDDLDGFKILALLGRGSMGRVYRARDAMGRNVALKVILAEQADPEGIKRFTREGQAMAAIPRHKNVVNVHTTGEVRGLPYLVLDYVDGKSLEVVLKRGRMLVLDAVALGIKLALAVQHVHQAGVLHRDLKPANILIRKEDGEPVVTDFGMAGVREGERITRTGDLLGTPLYMPPEQVLGMVRQIDARSDVWAIGAILYEALAGAPPFVGQSLVEVSRAITSSEPAPIEGIDASLMGVLRRAMAKRKEDRFQTPGELAEALVAWSDGLAPPPPPPPPAQRRRAVAVLGVVAAAVTALAATALWVAARRAHAPTTAGPPVESSTDGVAGATTAVAVGPSYGPFAAVVAQVQAGQVLAAAGLANQLRDARGPDVAPSAAAAEAVVRRELGALAAATPPRLDDLEAGLGIVRRLRGHAELRPAADPIADAVLRLFRERMEQLERVAAGNQAPGEQAFDPTLDVTVLEALCDSGLVPTDRPQTDRALDAALVAYVYARKLETEQYQRVLLAMLRFDVDLQRDQIVRVGPVDRRLSSTVWAEFLNLRIKSETVEEDGGRILAARELLELVESPRGQSLGPVCRARGLWMGVNGVADNETALKLLGRAAELDPASPWPPYQMTAFHLQWRRFPEAARWADETMTRLQRDDFDQRPSMKHYQTFTIYRDCVRAFIGAGDLARAQQLLTRLESFNVNYDKFDELEAELERALADAPPKRSSEF